MLEGVKKRTKRIFGIYSHDKRGREMIFKMWNLWQKGGTINRLRALRLQTIIERDFCVHVCPSTKVGKNFYISHCYEFGIGGTAIIGDNCSIYPNVHIAAKVKDETANKGERIHAKIGNDVMLCINSTIIGPITIGDDVIIGACAIVTKDVPSHSVVKGTNQIRPKRQDEIPEKYKKEVQTIL